MSMLVGQRVECIDTTYQIIMNDYNKSTRELKISLAFLPEWYAICGSCIQNLLPSHNTMGLFQGLSYKPQFTPRKRIKNGRFTPSNPSFCTSFNTTGSIIFGKSWFPGRCRCFFCRKQRRAAGNSFFTHPKLKSRRFIWDWRDLATFPFGGPAMLYTLMEWTCDQRNIVWWVCYSCCFNQYFDKHGQHEIVQTFPPTFQI